MKHVVCLAAVLTGTTALSLSGRKDTTIRYELSPTKDTAVPSADAVTVPEILPVPTTSRCIVITTIAYMVMLASLAITRTYHEITGSARGTTEAALKAGFQTLSYGPMICVLFLAYRMRVEFLSDGKGQPQWWAQACMYSVTFAMLASTLTVLIISLVLGKPMPVREASCQLAPVTNVGNQYLKTMLSSVRYTLLLGMYCGLAGVLWGMLNYRPTKDSELMKLPAPAPAVYCTMCIAIIFFVTQIIIAFSRTVTEFTGRDTASLVGIMEGAASTVEFGPMLCVLFLAARMRALQHGGQPQGSAQIGMFVATGALAFTTLLSVSVPLAFGGTMEIDPHTKQVTFEVPNTMDRIFGIALISFRYITIVVFYAATIVVIISIFRFESPAGAEHTLPISPTVQCVMTLTMQFFAIYFMQSVMISVSEVSQGEYPMETYSLFGALEAAKTTVQFAPMLAILCMTTRMYALLITDKKGAPQRWVQDSMYLATWSLLISALACLATGLTMGSVEQDEDGNVINKFERKGLAVAMVCLRYCCMAMFYGGIIAIISGLFAMTPQTANGRGSLPVVSDSIKVMTGVLF